MKKSRFFNLIGMGGVNEHESETARGWSHLFEIALFPVVVFALLAWYDNKRGQVLMGASFHQFADWFLWVFFFAELATMLLLVRHRWNYLRHNWFNIALIIVATPTLWNEQEFGILRALRFFLIVMKMANMSDTIRVVLSRNNLGLTILAVWVFVLFSGVVMTAIEPSFKSVGDGIWWAWATVTTVGYGDVVPVTGGGRLLAGLVMLIGMGLFSLITANFSAFFVAREERKIVEKEQEVLVGEQKILHHLQQIEARLHTLERKISEQKEDDQD